MSKKQKSNVGGAVAKIASVAALTAGAYLLFGPEGKKNRKKVSGWAVKMKGEMIEKFEEVKEVTEPIYHQVVDEVSKKYKESGVSEEDIAGVVNELKKHWKTLVKDTKKVVKKVSKKVSGKPAKKPVKKAAKGKK